MLPYSWLTIFLTSMVMFILIYSSWGSFFSSSLEIKELENDFLSKSDFWY